MVSAKGLISHLIIGGLIQPFIDQILSIDSVLGFRLGTENTVVNKKQTGETECVDTTGIRCVVSRDGTSTHTRCKSKKERPHLACDFEREVVQELPGGGTKVGFGAVRRITNQASKGPEVREGRVCGLQECEV